MTQQETYAIEVDGRVLGHVLATSDEEANRMVEEWLDEHHRQITESDRAADKAAEQAARLAR